MREEALKVSVPERVSAKGLSLEQYRQRIVIDECKFCGFVGLKQQPVQHYSHDGGWKVRGLSVLQWLFVVCPKCAYEWALNYLGVPR